MKEGEKIAGYMDRTKYLRKVSLILDKLLPDTMNFTAYHFGKICESFGKDNPLIFKHEFEVVEV